MTGDRRDPIDAERRRARKRRELPPDAACAFCGVNAIEVLQRHHASGDANDPGLIVWLCRNCHALQTAHQHDEGVDLTHDVSRSVIQRLAAAAQSRTVFFRDLADAEERDSALLILLEEALDREHSIWRDLPEAKP